MKLALFGYPRSGSTMLYELITQHLIASGAIEEYQKLTEVFNPRPQYHIVPFQNSHGELALREKRNVDNPVMTREERFSLMQTFEHQDYVVKFMSQDTVHSEILPWMLERYQFITVTRRNHLDAYLSWVIANHHNYFILKNDGTSESKPDYQPFVANTRELRAGTLFMSRYFTFVRRIPAIAHFVYEDMVETAPKEILRRCGLYHEGIHVPQSRCVKLHTLEEKLPLIENLDEVVEHYMNTIGTMVEYQ